MEELLESLKEEYAYELLGKITYDGDVIKWEYDCFGIDFDGEQEDYLTEIYEHDYELIKGFIEEEGYTSKSTPEIVDSFIFFYIE